MLSNSPLSSPSPRQKAEAEKKQREVEENERRKIYAETEAKNISKEERGEIYSEEQTDEEEEEEEGRESVGEEEEVAKRYKGAASSQDVGQVKIFLCI